MSDASSGSSANQAKYESRNPLQQALIARFQRAVLAQLHHLKFRTVLDVGCGEGFLARVLLDRFPGIELTGVDTSPSAVAAARSRCPEGDFHAVDVETLSHWDKRYDLVVCSEVLEHLDRPAEALAVLRRLSRAHALLTVPWEPWFQLANFARGKYLSRFGNHPEHVQHWSAAAFENFVRTEFEVDGRVVCFPWTVVLARARADARA